MQATTIITPPHPAGPASAVGLESIDNPIAGAFSGAPQALQDLKSANSRKIAEADAAFESSDLLRWALACATP